MAKGMLFDIGQKKLRSVDEIKADINAQIEALREPCDLLDEEGNVIFKPPSEKTIANAKKVMSGFVDAIDGSNEELEWHNPDVISKK